MVAKENMIVYSIIGITVLCATLSIVMLSVYLIVITSLLAFSSIMLIKIWYIIDAKLFEKTNMIQIFNGFELSGSRSAIIANHVDVFTGTAASVIESFGGGGEVTQDKIENLVSNTRVPFKIVLSVERLNTKGLAEKLETKKRMKEIELSRIQNQAHGKGLLRANQLRRDITFLENEINKIFGGNVPLKLVYYMTTSSISESRYKAEELAISQIREISSEFDATFNTKSRLLSGNELVDLMKFDHMIVV